MPCWWWRGRQAPATLAVAVLCAGPAAAQAPADRAALRSLQDSLQALTDAGDVTRFAPRWTHTTDRTMQELRSGWLALAAGRLKADRGALDDALVRFDAAAHRRPDWPWGWYSRGRAKLELSEGRFIPKEMAGQGLGVNFYQGARADLIRAFVADSTFADGVAYLAAVLPAQGDRSQPAGFVRALSVAARDSAASPRVRLVLARAYRTGGHSDAALRELGAYLGAGGDSALGLLETARTLAGAGRLEEAAEAYLLGARHRAVLSRAHYRRDLAWIATDEELADFDRLPDSSMAGWIERFWAFRDAEAVRATGERLREHLRRWDYAHRHFRIIAPERKTDFARVVVPDLGPCTHDGAKSLDDLTFEDPDRLDDLRRRERLLDHRGVIYIRHGEPAWRSRPSGIHRSELSPAPFPDLARPSTNVDDAAIDPYLPEGLTDGQSSVSGLASEIWAYWFDGSTRLLYFGPSVTLGTFAPTTLYSYIPLDPSLLYAAAEVDPRYRRVAYARELELAGRRRSSPVQCMVTTQQVQRETVAAMQASVESDSHTLYFPAPLDPVIQVAAVGDPDAGTGRLLVVFALPGERLAPERDTSRASIRYDVAFRISAVDRARGTILRLDTLRTFAARDAVRTGAYLTGYVELAAPRGDFEVRVAVFRPGGEAGSVAAQSGVQVAAGPGLFLSDIVLGSERAGLRWENRGSPFLLNALDAYRAGSEAPLYYEMHGLVPGRSYGTTIALRRVNEPETRAVRLLFAETADAETMQMRRTMGLEGLRRGQYRLTVTVVDAETGATAVRERVISVTD